MARINSTDKPDAFLDKPVDKQKLLRLIPETIEKVLGIAPTHPVLEALKAKSPETHDLPAETGAVREFIATHAAT